MSSITKECNERKDVNLYPKPPLPGSTAIITLIKKFHGISVDDLCCRNFHCLQWNTFFIIYFSALHWNKREKEILNKAPAFWMEWMEHKILWIEFWGHLNSISLRLWIFLSKIIYFLLEMWYLFTYTCKYIIQMLVVFWIQC